MRAPIKNYVNKEYPQGNVSQWFGENPDLYNKAVCITWNGEKICLKGHNGIDIVAPWGTPIYAVEGGKVVGVKTSITGYGMHVRISSKGKEWVYGHLSMIDVKENDVIEEGTKIGNMGNTGFVISGATPYWEHNPYAGTHLHLGCRLTSETNTPFSTTYKNGDTVFVKNWDNGYFGAVDFDIPEEQQQADITQLQLTVISLANEVIRLLRQLIWYNR